MSCFQRRSGICNIVTFQFDLQIRPRLIAFSVFRTDIAQAESFFRVSVYSVLPTVKDHIAGIERRLADAVSDVGREFEYTLDKFSSIADTSVVPLEEFSDAVLKLSTETGVLAAELNEAAYQAVSRGQYEAAEILGYSRSQTFFLIILPQVIKRVLPSVTNEVITLVKDTSLAQVLAVTEMFTVAKNLASAQVSVMPFIAAGIFYYLANAIVAVIMARIEKAMRYYS